MTRRHPVLSPDLRPSHRSRFLDPVLQHYVNALVEESPDEKYNLKNTGPCKTLNLKNCIATYDYLLTVCKSRRNSISATKPAPIPNGAKLIHASNFPNRSPVNSRAKEN